MGLITSPIGNPCRMDVVADILRTSCMKGTIGLLVCGTAWLTACTSPPQPLPAPVTPTPAFSPAVKPLPPQLPTPPSTNPSPLPSGNPKVEFQPVDEAPPVDAQRPDAPANPQIPENPDARTPAQRYNTQPLTPASPAPKKYGQPIGPATDCDRDGKADDTLVDYTGDGIPDECLKGDG
jgi:hypothetical protein